MIELEAVRLALILERAVGEVVLTHTYTKQRIDVATYRQKLQRNWGFHWPDLDLDHSSYYRPTIANGETRELLLDTVKEALNQFVRDDRVQTAAIVLVGGYGTGFTLDDVVDRLVEVAIGRGTRKAAYAFLQGIHGSPITYRQMALLAGAQLEANTPVRDGIRMVKLPNSTSDVPSYFPSRSPLRSSDILGRTLLVIDHTVKAMFADPELQKPYDELFQRQQVCSELPDFDVHQFCEALSLASDGPIACVAEWIHVDPDAVFNPRWPNTGNIALYPLAPRPRSLVMATKLRVKDAVGIYGTRKTLSTGPNLDYEVPIQRWIRSKSDQLLTDKFIDLRIALESLYLKDFLDEYSQEMRFRLPLFGAWHLGSDFNERRWIRKRLRDAYDRASGAVHGGAVDGVAENQELLSDAQDLCRRGILKLLSEGEPDDWGDVALGSGFDGIST